MLPARDMFDELLTTTGWLTSLRSMIPFWSYAKLIATCWLVIPYFSGAAFVYEHFVRPFFLNPPTVNIWYIPRKKDTFSKRDDILTAAQKYMDENGPEALQRLINEGDREPGSGSSHYTFYDQDYRY